MSTEDDLDEVYRDFDRTRSDVDTEALEEAIIKRESEAKQQAHTQMHKQLIDDLSLAGRWLFAVANKSIRMKNEDDSPTYTEDDDAPLTPLSEIELSEIWKTLDSWQNYPACATERPQLENGVDTEVEVVELTMRTARRLQSDCVRLLNLVAFLTGRKPHLKVEDVDWMVPYLEGQLKLFREKYKDFAQEARTYLPHDLDALATRHALERRLSSEARILLAEPLVDFEKPKFDQEGIETSVPEDEESNTVQKSKFESASDHLSPRSPLFHVEKENGQSMRHKMEDKIEEQGTQSPGYIDPMEEANATSDAPDSETIAQIGRLAQKLIKSNRSKQARLGKVVGISETLLKENARLKRKLKKQSKRLEREQEKPQMSGNQITEVLAMSKGDTALERLFERGNAIEGNIQAEEQFQIKKARFGRQIEEFEEWRRAMKQEEAERGLGRAASRVHSGHGDLMKDLQRNFKSVELEREAAWVEYIAGIDGISESDKKIWRGLRGVTSSSGPTTAKADDVEPSRHASLECLYCDKEFCSGCAGDGREYDQPWLEL
jgi:hypothetical protein